MTPHARKVLIGSAIAFIAGLVVLGFVAGVVVSGWRAAIRAGNEAATIQNLKTIAAVEVLYFNTHKRTFGTFDELIKEQILTEKFSGSPVTADGYVLELKLSGPQSSFALTADPQDSSTGRNHFYLDSTAEKIHVNPDHQATASDPIQ